MTEQPLPMLTVLCFRTINNQARDLPSVRTTTSMLLVFGLVGITYDQIQLKALISVLIYINPSFVIFSVLYIYLMGIASEYAIVFFFFGNSIGTWLLKDYWVPEFLLSYLRQHPIHKGREDHPSSFLSDETWEEYLRRMARPGEWSDHIILQALADVLCLEVIIFNVFYDDIRRTEVIGKLTKQSDRPLIIFLGHLGEFHYLSLRSKRWLRHWPYSNINVYLL